MHPYLTDNEHLAQLQRAALANDPAWTQHALSNAQNVPHVALWVKRLLQEIGKDLKAEILHLLQEFVHAESVPLSAALSTAVEPTGPKGTDLPAATKEEGAKGGESGDTSGSDAAHRATRPRSTAD
jgi:hypothetical protein